VNESITKTACFFSSEGESQIMKQQYSLQDISILTSLGYRVVVCSRLKDIPFGCDLYFGWWAAGSMLPLLVAKLSRKPIIVVTGGNETLHYQDSISGIKAGYLATPWYKKLATQITLKFADSVLVVSEFMHEGIKKVSKRSTRVVHLSVNTDTFKPDRRKREYITTLSAFPENFVIKRFAVFVEAAAIVKKKFPSQKFLLIGTEPPKGSNILRLIDELGLSENMVFSGHVPNNKVPDLLNSSRCFVYISDTETFGVAAVEAMSCNVPLIVSKQGALPEVTGKFGINVDHNDSKSVAGAMLEVLSDFDDESYSSLDSRTFVKEHFSYKKRKKIISSVIATLPGD